MQPKIRLTQFQLRKRRRPLPAEATSFVTLISNMNTVNSSLVDTPRGGGDSSYERGWDARWEFWIKLLKETNLGVAQALFDS